MNQVGKCTVYCVMRWNPTCNITNVGWCRLYAAGADTKALVMKNLLVDTLEVMKELELIGLSRKQAEQLTRQVTDLLVLNKLRTDEQYVSKTSLEKVILEQEANIVGFKTEISKSQDMFSANILKDLERQQSFLDKMRAEVRHEIDKLTASQRLDLNLEKGRMRDDLQGLRDKTTQLEIKLDRDINDLKAAVEKSKNDVIKSVITILGTFSAIAFTMSRFMQMSAGG